MVKLGGAVHSKQGNDEVSNTQAILAELTSTNPHITIEEPEPYTPPDITNETIASFLMDPSEYEINSTMADLQSLIRFREMKYVVIPNTNDVEWDKWLKSLSKQAFMWMTENSKLKGGNVLSCVSLPYYVASRLHDSQPELKSILQHLSLNLQTEFRTGLSDTDGLESKQYDDRTIEEKKAFTQKTDRVAELVLELFSTGLSEERRHEIITTLKNVYGENITSEPKGLSQSSALDKDVAELEVRIQDAIRRDDYGRVGKLSEQLGVLKRQQQLQELTPELER